MFHRHLQVSLEIRRCVYSEIFIVFLVLSLSLGTHLCVCRLTSIGLVDKTLRRAPIWPGWKANTLGYHGDDGNLYLGTGGGAGEHKKEAKSFADGDVVGCGYDP